MEAKSAKSFEGYPELSIAEIIAAMDTFGMRQVLTEHQGFEIQADWFMGLDVKIWSRRESSSTLYRAPITVLVQIQPAVATNETLAKMKGE